MAKENQNALNGNNHYGDHSTHGAKRAHRPTVRGRNEQHLDWAMLEEIRDGENIDLDVERINERLERQSYRSLSQ